jgi:MFS family permease
MGCAWTDIAPVYSSSINSLGNTVGASAGIVGPIVVAAFVDGLHGAAGWQAAFILTFCLSACCMVVWWRYIKAEIVPALNTPAVLPGDSE